MSQNKKDCKNCGGNCSDCADERTRLQQRILEREVDEELRQEQLAAFWKKYRFLILGGIACIILGTMFHEWYLAWQTKQSIAESDRFEKAVISSVTGQTDQALTDLEQLGKDGRTGYRYLAQIKQATILMRSQKEKEGLSILKQLFTDTNTPAPFRDAAIISYVGNQVSTGNDTEMNNLLRPIVSDSQNPFYGQAIELSALLAYIAGDTKKATDLLEASLQSERIPPLTRERLSVLKKGL